MDLRVVLPDIEVQDFVWTWQSECLIKEKTLMQLHANGFSGFGTKPVEARFKKSERVPPTLWELALTGWGGLVGILLGWITAEIVKMAMPTFVPLWAPIVGFVVSVGLGVGFGLWPAWKAARLDPIEALRYE